ncbi:MAG: hypothetical protein ETSY1_22895 [Candidatus Entotheonella factor]|uniref:Uncharacterized protein n=1 Tax=Entotheonella factor TaxID=1429438 RepID=W4LHC6_ENTF1|nr:MAG: hypothetical protein ETSY1_22895 [Candidatus Entotheonella factor]
MPDGELHFDFKDDITYGACITHAGEIRHDSLRQAVDEKKEE